MLRCVVGCAVPDVSNDFVAFEVCGLGGDLGFSESRECVTSQKTEILSCIVVAVNPLCIVKFSILRNNIYRSNVVFWSLGKTQKRNAALVAR